MRGVLQQRVARDAGSKDPAYVRWRRGLLSRRVWRPGLRNAEDAAYVRQKTRPTSRVWRPGLRTPRTQRAHDLQRAERNERAVISYGRYVGRTCV